MLNTIMQRIQENKFVLIAEIGVNYYDIAKQRGISAMEAAKLMIDRAKVAGVHAVKFQTYKAETLAAKNSPSYWDTSEEAETSQFALFKKFDSFGQTEYQSLANYCDEIGIEFLSTPFDIESADYLYNMMNIYKISSSDLNNLPFVEYQAKKNKPIIISAGASNLKEIRTSIDLIRKYNNQPIVLMHCVLEYPTPYEHANLNQIVTLKKEFPNLIIGYSDHTKPDEGYNVIQTAYNLGAQVIEKHFTLDKTLSGNDHYHAMDENDVTNIVKKIDYIDLIRGDYEVKCLPSEMAARENARRSLVSACKIYKGTIISPTMIIAKRPGTGILANDFGKIVGKTILQDVEEDTILKESMFTNTDDDTKYNKE